MLALLLLAMAPSFAQSPYTPVSKPIEPIEPLAPEEINPAPPPEPEPAVPPPAARQALPQKVAPIGTDAFTIMLEGDEPVITEPEPVESTITPAMVTNRKAKPVENPLKMFQVKREMDEVRAAIIPVNSTQQILRLEGMSLGSYITSLYVNGGKPPVPISHAEAKRVQEEMQAAVIAAAQRVQNEEVPIVTAPPVEEKKKAKPAPKKVVAKPAKQKFSITLQYEADFITAENEDALAAYGQKIKGKKLKRMSVLAYQPQTPMMNAGDLAERLVQARTQEIVKMLKTQGAAINGRDVSIIMLEGPTQQLPLEAKAE